MKIVILFFVVCSLAYAQRVVLESEASSGTRGLPLGWSSIRRSPHQQGLQLMFALKQTHLAELESTLMRVSDPDSEQYGQHLSNEEVHALVAPDDAHIAAVKNFLKKHGITAICLTPNCDMVQADVTVSQAEKLLATEYHELHHSDSGLTVHRAMQYSVPASIAEIVDFVAPTVHIPPAPKKPIRADPTPGAVTNTPKELRRLYSVDVVGKAPTNKMAVTAFLDQHYSKGDLHEFWTLFCTNMTCGKGDPGLVGDESASVPAGAGVESMLDIQSITGVAGNVTAEFWGFAGRSPDNKENEPFLKWLTQMSQTSDDKVPKVFSTSYGEDEKSWSLAAATRLNTEFQKAGTRGISLLFASGDEGANCESGKFVPETPGSSPWVTAVGGTYLGGNSAIGLSSGGFSNRWAQPSWQADAVKQYLTQSGLPPTSVGYNISGRAYPDIAAQANDFTVVVDRVPLPGVAGTSCASPSASGVIAMLNDARLVAGKPVLGFLNPWIYKNGKKWNDITKGTSNGGQCGNGWPAKAGWDAVTGYGSPNYKNLVAV